jgi:hypothetical protein
VKKKVNMQFKTSSAKDDEDNEYIGWPRPRQRENSDNSIDNSLNEIASNTFNQNLFKEVLSV